MPIGLTGVFNALQNGIRTKVTSFRKVREAEIIRFPEHRIQKPVKPRHSKEDEGPIQ